MDNTLHLGIFLTDYMLEGGLMYSYGQLHILSRVLMVLQQAHLRQVWGDFYGYLHKESPV